MTIFWILAVVLTALAVGLVVWPLLGGGVSGFTPAARALKGQLASLDRAWTDGHLDEASYQARRADLVSALSDEISQPASVEPPPGKARFALAIAVPALALAIYWGVGNPDGLGPVATVPATANDQPNSLEPAETAPELETAVAGLAARLEANPDDVDGWMLLGHSYMQMSQYEAAESAYEQAYQRKPDEPSVLERYAQAMVFAANSPTPPHEAMDLFERALSLNPEAPRALFFLGIDAFQREQYDDSIGYWQRLKPLVEGAESEQLAEMIAEANTLAGRTDDSMPAASPAPVANSDIQGEGPSLAVTVSLDESHWNSVKSNDVVFVFARASEGPRMPLAIQRLTVDQLPTTIVLNESMAMSPAMSLSSFPEVIVGARLSRSGNAAPQSGDIEALSSPTANDSADPIVLKLERVIP